MGKVKLMYKRMCVCGENNAVDEHNKCAPCLKTDQRNEWFTLIVLMAIFVCVMGIIMRWTYLSLREKRIEVEFLERGIDIRRPTYRVSAELDMTKVNT